MRTLIGIVTACGISVALAQQQSAHSTATQFDARVIAENEFVQVVRISIPGHGSTPIHQVTPRAVVWLRDAHYIDRFADGSVKEERRKAGDAEWVPMRRHSGQNLSGEPMEFVAIVIKAAAARGHQGDAASPQQ